MFGSFYQGPGQYMNVPNYPGPCQRLIVPLSLNILCFGLKTGLIPLKRVKIFEAVGIKMCHA